MASAQVVETSVANNSPSQDSSRPADHFQSRKRLTLMERIVIDTNTTVIIKVFMSILSTASPKGKLRCYTTNNSFEISI